MGRRRVELRTFSAKIKEYRKEKGYSQIEFANKINFSVDTVKNWEQGWNIPEITTVLKIADILECSTDSLFGRIEEKTHDLHFICENTGLSEEAIKTIIGYKEIQDSNTLPALLETLDKLLTEPALFTLLASIDNCLKNNKMLNSIKKEHADTINDFPINLNTSYNKVLANQDYLNYTATLRLVETIQNINKKIM